MGSGNGAEKMTNMEWIEEIVKQGGVHYGHTVQRNEAEGKAPPTAKIRNQRKCETCGKWFDPDILADGSISRKKRCRECITKIHDEIQRKKLERLKKKRKEYERKCDRCGAIVKTTQAPRSNVPIYCVDCRKNRKKGDGMVKYRGGNI